MGLILNTRLTKNTTFLRVFAIFAVSHFCTFFYRGSSYLKKPSSDCLEILTGDYNGIKLCNKAPTSKNNIFWENYDFFSAAR